MCNPVLSLIINLCRFLPQLTKNALQQALSSAGIAPPGMTHIQQHMQPVKCECAHVVVRDSHRIFCLEGREGSKQL